MRAFLLSLTLLAACAHAPAAQAPQPAADAEAGTWYAGLRDLAREVAAARGVSSLKDFSIVALDEAEFLDRFASSAREQNEAMMADLDRTLAAFIGTRDPLLVTDTRDKMRSVLQEQVPAFYHFGQHTLYVRKTLPELLAKESSDDVRLTLLAHELGHVLQDQWGLHMQGDTFEQVLAHRAVLEGDAMLTAELVLAARRGIPPTRIVERSRFAATKLTAEEVIEAGGLSPKLLAAPPALRQTFLFPYTHGKRFIADVYRAGGLELVQQVLAHPPDRTDSIFAPQQWLDGRPRRLAPLDAKNGRLGVLMLRTMLEACGRVRDEPTMGAWFAERYEDDTFRVEGGALVWSVALSGLETNAGLNAMAGVALCLGHRGTDWGNAGGDGVYTLALGGKHDAMKALAEAARPKREAASSPPFGKQTVPEVSSAVAYRAAGLPEVQGQRWALQRVGLSGSFADATVGGNQAAPLVLKAPSAMLVGAFVDERPGQKTNDAFVNGFLLAALKGRAPAGLSFSSHYTWQPMPEGGPRGWEARIDYPELVGPAKVRILSLCGGAASFNVIALLLAPDGDQVIARWLKQLEGAAGAAPICSEK